MMWHFFWKVNDIHLFIYNCQHLKELWSWTMKLHLCSSVHLNFHCRLRFHVPWKKINTCSRFFLLHRSKLWAHMFTMEMWVAFTTWLSTWKAQLFISLILSILLSGLFVLISIRRVFGVGEGCVFPWLPTAGEQQRQLFPGLGDVARRLPRHHKK